MSNKVTLSQYFEKELLEETSASERNRNDSLLMYEDEDVVPPMSLENEEEIDIYTSYASYMSSSDPGSDNILVTIDYGSMDMDEDLSVDSLGIVEEEEPEENLKKMDYLQVPSRNVRMSKIKEERSKESLLKSSESLLRRVLNPFQVHHVQHTDTGTATNSAISSMNSLREYNVDTSGDYGSWQQQPESDYGDTGTPREYRYEDLIKNESINEDNNYYDGDGGDDIGGVIINRVEEDDVDDNDLVNFSYDVALSARWSSDNDNRYYRSVDYLN